MIYRDQFWLNQKIIFEPEFDRSEVGMWVSPEKKDQGRRKSANALEWELDLARSIYCVGRVWLGEFWPGNQ